MDKGKTYEVKNIKLAGQGRLNIEWAESQMGALLKVRERFQKEKPLQGLKVGMALHITKETAALVRTLVAGGAKTAITGCNPLSTQDDAAAALAEQGKDGSINVYGWKGETTKEYYACLKKVIEFRPDITIDDGCDLVSEVHKNYPNLIKTIIGGTEETTTGVIRLRAMEKGKALKYPVIAVNDLKTKHLFDNYLGTGQSTIDGILRATSILLAGKNFVVIGYGPCGKGVSIRAKGHGANVIVCEINPIRALQALTDGYRVMPIKEAAKIGDVFVTVTGNKHVISIEHIKTMKSGAILANSGHFDIEIDVAGLEKTAKKKRIRQFLDEYSFDGKKVYLCGEGRLVNLAAAEGHPSVVMAQSFCGQALATEYLAKNKGKLPTKVISLPEGVDKQIAELQLEALGIKIDKPTAEQKKYVESWEEGT